MPDPIKPNKENSITLLPTQGQRRSSGDSFADWLVDEITGLGEAFGESLTAERQAIYVRALADISMDRLRHAFQQAVKQLKWFPKVAEIRELASIASEVQEQRPGPEEAWAKMPKGDRMEEDSIVWCAEERAAYSSCRSLLLDGDLIGARMAFKERYAREIAEAQAQGRPLRWIISAGFDIEHRLSTLANAVQIKQIQVEECLPYIPPERESDFARMLPPSAAKGLLTGTVQEITNLPGLLGLLAQMRMEGTIPEELKYDARPVSQKTPSDRSREEVRELREKANSQKDFLKRSRNRERNGKSKTGRVE